MDMKKFAAEFSRKQPISGMALAYLLENGTETVKKAVRELFEYATEGRIKWAEKHGETYPYSLDTAMQVFDLAKEYAELNAFDLVTAVGAGVYGQHYLNSVFGKGTFLGKATCPDCGHNVFSFAAMSCDDQSKPICENGEPLFVCKHCGKVLRAKDTVPQLD